VKSDFLLLQVTHEADSIPAANVLMKSPWNHVVNSSVRIKCCWQTFKSYTASFPLLTLTQFRVLYDVNGKYSITFDVRYEPRLTFDSIHTSVCYFLLERTGCILCNL